MTEFEGWYKSELFLFMSILKFEWHFRRLLPVIWSGGKLKEKQESIDPKNHLCTPLFLSASLSAKLLAWGVNNTLR